MQEEQISNEKSALQFEVKENKLQSSQEKENRFHEKPSRSNRRSQKKTAPTTESGGSVSSVRENRSSKVPPPLQKRSKLKFEEPHSFKSNEEVRSSLKEEVPRLTDKEINKLGRLKYKKATAEEKYQKAKGKLPTKKKRSLQFESVSDGESKNHRLRFDKEEFMDTKKRSKILGKAKSEVTAQTKETFTKALDGGEREESTDETQVKGLLHTGKKVAIAPIKAPLQFKRFRDERHLKKFHQAEKKWVKAHVNFDMQSSKVQDRLSHTSKNSNPLSRAFQKRRLKKAYKEKLKAGSKKASKRLLKEVKKLLMLIKAPLLKIGMVCLVIVLILLVITSCSAVVTNMIQAMLTGTTFASYTADEGEIEQADWFFSALETDFETKIENAEQEYPHTDETLYFLNGNPSTKEELIAQMNHDPFALIAYLTVMYDDFIFEQIKPHIKQIFDELFVLDIRVDTEIRTRTAYDSDGIPFEENYEYNILMVNLTVNDFEEVATPYMQGIKDDGLDHYDTLIDTEGNHQSYGSPLNMSWHSKITCHYGGRDNPTGANTGQNTADGREMHTGLDIGVPTGTPIYSVMKGTITFAGWHNLYGNYIDVTDANGNKSRYAHLSSIKVTTGQKVKKGELIALSGATGNVTGPHLHIEIFQKGQRINPLFVLAREPKSESEET